MNRNKIHQEVLASTLSEVRAQHRRRRTRSGIAGVAVMALALTSLWFLSEGRGGGVTPSTVSTTADSGVTFTALEVLEVTESHSEKSCIEWLPESPNLQAQTRGIGQTDVEELLENQAYAIVARSDGKKEMIVFQEL